MMTRYRLACFDLDGTLVKNVKVSWQLFHDHFGSDSTKREEAYAAFKRGDLAYTEWANHDVRMWKELGKTKQDFFEAIKESGTTLLPGARETLEDLKRNGFKLAVISGSMDVFLEYFFPDCEELFDDIFISKIKFGKDGVVLGVDATEYDMRHKATALKIIADRESIPLEETVFVGDYRNDIEALQLAGLGIAFNSDREDVRYAADKTVDADNLKELLPLLLPGSAGSQ